MGVVIRLGKCVGAAWLAAVLLGLTTPVLMTIAIRR